MSQNSVGSMKKIAQSFVLEGRYDSAVVLYGRVVQLKPKDYNSWNAKFNCEIQLKQFQQAKQSGWKLISMKGDNANIYYLMAQVCKNLGEADSTIEYLNISIKTSPTYVPSLKMKGEILAKGQEYNKALLVYEQLISITSQDPEIWYMLGSCKYLSSGHIEDGCEGWRKASEMGSKKGQEMNRMYCGGR